MAGQCFRTCWEENPNRKKIRSCLFSWCVSEVTRLECRLNLAQQRHNLVHLSPLYAGYTLKNRKRNFWNYKLVLVGNFKENSKHTCSGKWFSEMQYVQHYLWLHFKIQFPIKSLQLFFTFENLKIIWVILIPVPWHSKRVISVGLFAGRTAQSLTQTWWKQIATLLHTGFVQNTAAAGTVIL